VHGSRLSTLYQIETKKMMNMNKKTIIAALLALIWVVGQAQTQKTTIVKGFSPALEDSTVVNIYIDNDCRT